MRDPFLRLWGAAAASNLADGVFQVALVLKTLELTRSPTAVAGVAFAARLPWLLLALHAGVVADRMDRRRVLVAGSLLRALLLALLALLGAVQLDHVVILYVVAFGLGVAETIFDTTIHTVVPRLVPAGRLEWANGRMQAADLVMQQFLGPPLGGLLAGLGVALAFTGSAAAYLGCAVLLASMGHVTRRAPGTAAAPAAGAAAPRGSTWADIREGLGFLWGHRLLRRLALGGAGLNAAFAAVLAALPLHAVAPGPAGLSAASYGVLMTAAGAGGLVAALSAAWVQRRLGTAWTLRASLAALALGFALPALTARPAFIALGLALTGATTFYNIITVSIRQRSVPDHLLGRVSSCYRLFVYGGLPIGSALAGVVGQLVGLRAVFAGAAAVVAVVGARLLRDVPREASARAEEEIHVPAAAE